MIRNKQLVLLLGLGALARLLLLIWFHGQTLYVHDERDYNDIAVNLVQDGQFASPAGNLTSIRPPLYPFWLSLVYRVFGIENYDAVRIVQAFLSLVNVVLLHRLANNLFAQRVAMSAAALYCFYPSLLWSTCLLLTETVFTFWLLLLCLCLQQYLNSRHLLPLMSFGVVLGLAALTRSVLWLFPPFLLVYLWLVDDSKRLASRLTILAVPVIGFALTIMPWTIRNTRLHKTFTTIDVMGGRNFMMGNYEHTPLFRAWDAISIHGAKSWNAVLNQELAGRKLTQGQRDKAAMRHGTRFVLGHPVLTIKRSVVKFCNFWQLERSVVSGAQQEWWGIRSRWLTVVLAVIVLGFYVISIWLGVFGYILVPPSDRRLHWFILLLVAFVCAVHTAVFGHSRYHLPLMPLVLMYSAAAIVNIESILRQRKRASFVLAAAICVCLVASWTWEFVVVDLPRLGLQ